MSWWEWYCSLWTGDTLQCELSWWVTRQLVAPRLLPRGSKVLVIDNDPNDLTELLVFRGYDAVGLDAVNQRIVTSHHASECPIRFVNKSLVLPEHYFDVVIARDLQVYQLDLASDTSLTTSANLLSAIKPGGRLSVLVRQKSTWQDYPGTHLRSCYSRHFQQFQLNCNQRFVGDGWLRWRTWNWMLGDQPRWGHLIVSTTIPFDTVTRTQWHERAAGETRATHPACCAWSRRKALQLPVPTRPRIPNAA